MSKFQLKIPPVLVTILFAIMMWLVAKLLPGINSPNLFRLDIFAVFIIAGAIFSISGVVSFSIAKTSVNPITPAACSSLVTSGMYKKTRNPMYVGFLFFLVGWSLFLSNPYSLTLCAGFILYMNRFQIAAEEKVLESLFGAEFLTYKNQVRRWL